MCVVGHVPCNYHVTAGRVLDLRLAADIGVATRDHLRFSCRTGPDCTSCRLSRAEYGHRHRRRTECCGLAVLEDRDGYASGCCMPIIAMLAGICSGAQSA